MPRTACSVNATTPESIIGQPNSRLSSTVTRSSKSNAPCSLIYFRAVLFGSSVAINILEGHEISNYKGPVKHGSMEKGCFKDIAHLNAYCESEVERQNTRLLEPDQLVDDGDALAQAVFAQ